MSVTAGGSVVSVLGLSQTVFLSNNDNSARCADPPGPIWTEAKHREADLGHRKIVLDRFGSLWEERRVEKQTTLGFGVPQFGSETPFHLFARLQIHLLAWLVAFAALASAQGAAQPFIWEVKHPQKPGTVYLFGSIHVLNPKDPLPPLVDTIFPLSDKVIFEADLDDPGLLNSIRSRAYLSGSDSLRNYLSASTYSSLDSFLKSRRADWIQLAPDAPAHFSQLRPWLAFTWAMEMKYAMNGLSGNHGVDRRLLTRARQAGKPLEFLESTVFQLRVLEHAIAGNENGAVLSVLNENPKDLVSAWLAGDAAALKAKIDAAYAHYPGAAAVLLDQRNWNWLPKIEAEFSQNRRTLVVVGAGHLFGNAGLLKLLLDRGYSAERLPAAPRVIRQPATQDTVLGSTITLSAMATGTPPLSYQWQKNGTNIAGATTTSLVLTNVQFHSAGSYSVRASNSTGTTNSAAALIRVFDVSQYTPFYMVSDLRKLELWLYERTNVVAVTSLNGGMPHGLDWHPVGTADLNGDAHTDILFQHTDGRMAAWLMQGNTRHQNVALKPINPAWRAVVLADMDGDAKADIVFRHTDGRAAVWYMNGITFGTSGLLNGAKPVNLSWRLAAAAHFDANGKADLLWQNSAGNLAVWLLDGTNVISKLPLRDGLPVAARAVGGFDLNSDHKTDLIFQRTSGQMSYWLMDGLDYVSAGPLQNGRPTPHQWRFLGTR